MSKPFESPFKEKFLKELGVVLNTRVVLVDSKQLTEEDLEELKKPLHLFLPDLTRNDTL